MNVAVVGAGPAGLYFALLLKQHDPAHRLRVIEQNPADNTYGWGVVFSDRALEFLQASTPQVYSELTHELETWDDLTIIHRDQAVAIDGSGFAAIARIRLLQILQRHCQHLGVELCFNTRLETLTDVQDCDLIVGADGVNSRVRELNAQAFQPSRRYCTNHYIWYGTTRLFPTLSLIFRDNADGVFVAHTYRYSPTMSTFIVECDAATWRTVGFADLDDAESRAYCADVFAVDLQGAPLLSNKSTWLNFPQVSNVNWHHVNNVLLGDALRSVHFSIGSGTRTALQDASSLAAACIRHGDDVPAALAEFVATRRPEAQRLQEVADRSLHWYENFRAAMRLDPLAFVMDYMTRGGRVELATLRQRSPRFVAAWEGCGSSLAGARRVGQ